MGVLCVNNKIRIRFILTSTVVFSAHSSGTKMSYRIFSSSPIVCSTAISQFSTASSTFFRWARSALISCSLG